MNGDAAQTMNSASRRQKTKKKAPEEQGVPSGADAGLPIDGVVERKNLMGEG
jgi:hypothetical protein